MHGHSLSDWRHDHVFLGEAHDRNERRTWMVVGLTAAMMVAEIAGGTIFGSMALLADGWHMSTHAGALAIAAGAYRYARRHARDPRFAFGTGKLGDLAGFASAIVLAMVSLGIGYEIGDAPVPAGGDPLRRGDGDCRRRPRGQPAERAAAVGRSSPYHDHDDRDGHDDSHDGHDHHHHHDHNLRAAYWHVLADALTSILAIAGLLAAWAYGWTWLDPAIGIVGACVIAHWSWGLIRNSGAVLLDAAPNKALERTIRERLEQGHDRIADLHVWRLGPGHHGAIVALVADEPEPVEHYKARLADVAPLSHLTIEVHRCTGAH